MAKQSEQVRVLHMTAGNLQPPKCHNHAKCGKEATCRIQYFEQWGWVTRYYECNGWQCQDARNIKDAVRRASEIEAVTSGS